MSIDAVNNLMKLAKENGLVDVVGGSQSIEEWSNDIIRTYRSRDKRPDVIVLALKRYGECYRGELYITKEDFKTE